VPVPPNVDRDALSLALGLYDRQSTQRVGVIQSNAPVLDDALQLGAPGAPGP